MPNRSDRRTSMTPPHAKPNMVSVNGSDASARATPNSACTAGSTTGTDHMPTLPMVPSTTATLSRHQAKGDSAPPSKVPDLSILLVRATPRGAYSLFPIGFLSSGLPCQLAASRATAILHRRGGCPHGCRASRPWPPGGLVPAAARRVTFPGSAGRAPQAQSDATSDRLDARGDTTDDAEDDQRPGVSALVVRPARAGRLRACADLFRHDRREGRAGADARRREDRDRHLPPGHGRQAPCPAGPVDS